MMPELRLKELAGICLMKERANEAREKCPEYVCA
jgi:hypothetical protein